MNVPAAAALAAPQLSLSLIGVPNCGKTALFNRLTGSRQKVANYPGVTVERKEGRLVGPRTGRIFRIVDLPGAYSLEPATLDEAIARDVVLGRHASEPAPDLLICVVDATNLRLNLRLVLELKRLGRPMIVALNMSDVAEQRGYRLDRAALEKALGIPVIRTVAVRSGGERELIEAIDSYAFSSDMLTQARTRLESPALATAADIEATQREARRVLAAAGYHVPARVAALAKLDQVVLNPVAGPLLLGVVLFLMFQAVFSWAKAPQAWINAGVAALSGWLSGVLPPGPLRGLILEGVLAGTGSVLVFLPQIVLLFAFILALEDSGYLPRAAFMLDRLMGRVGLSGRAFIPLLSSFACAIPGIMAARTIPSNRDRLATIMIAPLMTCSARLPVYALLIGAFIPQRSIGFLNLRGMVLFALYLAGVVSALAVAFVLKRRGARGEYRALLLELPEYRLPHLSNLLLGLWERTKIFLSRVGTIILALMVVLWFLASFPAPPAGATGSCDPVQHRRLPRPRPRGPVRADRLQLADIARAGAGTGGARGGGEQPRHRVRDVRQRHRGHGRRADADHRAQLVARHGTSALGLVRVRAAVPLDARGGEARNQLLALPAVHGGVSVRARLPRRLPHLPRGIAVRRRGHRMSAVLQGLIVGLVVLACAIYSTWRLLSARLRLRVLDALSVLPGLKAAAWFAALRARTLSKSAGGCGSCAPAATGAASPKRTPGALRR